MRQWPKWPIWLLPLCERKSPLPTAELHGLHVPANLCNTWQLLCVQPQCEDPSVLQELYNLPPDAYPGNDAFQDLPVPHLPQTSDVWSHLRIPDFPEEKLPHHTWLQFRLSCHSRLFHKYRFLLLYNPVVHVSSRQCMVPHPDVR